MNEPVLALDTELLALDTELLALDTELCFEHHALMSTCVRPELEAFTGSLACPCAPVLHGPACAPQVLFCNLPRCLDFTTLWSPAARNITCLTLHLKDLAFLSHIGTMKLL
jgi:hypothetical protein